MAGHNNVTTKRLHIQEDYLALLFRVVWRRGYQKQRYNIFMTQFKVHGKAVFIIHPAPFPVL